MNSQRKPIEQFSAERPKCTTLVSIIIQFALNVLHDTGSRVFSLSDNDKLFSVLYCNPFKKFDFTSLASDHR